MLYKKKIGQVAWVKSIATSKSMIAQYFNNENKQKTMKQRHQQHKSP